MKKIFTLVAMAAVSFAANAQVVGGSFATESLPSSAVINDENPDGGYSSETPITLAENDYMTITTGTPDDIQKTDSKKNTTSIGYYATSSTYNDSKFVIVKDENGNQAVIDCSKCGFSGSCNPYYEDKSTNVSAVIADTKLPSHGCNLKITTKPSDSWSVGGMYVVVKFSGNKQYIVFEDGTPIPYYIDYDGNKDNSKNISITPSDLGYDADNEKWNDGATLPKIDDALGLSATSKSGTGVISFDVTPNKTYYVMAIGSKISTSGYAFIPGGYAETVEVARMTAGTDDTPSAQEESVWLIKEGASVVGDGYAAYEYDVKAAVKTVAAATVSNKVVKTSNGIIKNGVKYNYAGQRVK